jgi:putative restriction endonuclease
MLTKWAAGIFGRQKLSRMAGRTLYYDFMREVSPGDVIFSFSGTYIKAIGIAASHCYESPKPIEFGNAGAYWDKIGWRVDVRFIELNGAIRPAYYMDRLGPLLPQKYAPLQQNGKGLQGVYLASLSQKFAEALVDIIGYEARTLISGVRVKDSIEAPTAVGLVEWEEHELAKVAQNVLIPETTRKAVVLARRGQGLFKQNVLNYESRCRITGVDKIEHLRASHCKPWRDSTNEERLVGENGLLLTPSIDHLFDRGFISFEKSGEVLISPVAHIESLQKMGVQTTGKLNVGAFSDGQSQFLQYHRESVFLQSKYIAR